MTDIRITDRIFKKSNRETVIKRIKENPSLYSKYKRLTDDLMERLEDFLCGKATLPLTYDPFFKKIFNPDIYPERLESFISSVIGEKVKIKGVLTQEESLLQGTSLLIMDIVVELESGSIANVEIQKISYLFPEQRMSCYSADLLLRQYSRVRGKMGEKFTYRDLKKVYTIIIFENSPVQLKGEKMKDKYVHKGKTTFDSGAEFDLLLEYYLIPLDVFQKSYYSKVIRDSNELNAWLALLSIDRVERLDDLIKDFPWMEEICSDMASYIEKPEEVVGMFSDALRILDENTVHYMIELQQKQIEDDQRIIAEKDAALSEKDAALAEKEILLSELKSKIEKLENEIAETGK